MDWVRALLLNEYHGERGFITGWIDLLCHYERLLEALPRVQGDSPTGFQQLEEAWASLNATVAERPRLVYVARYRQSLRTLCDKWGLRCRWAPAWVHSANLRWANRAISPEEIMAVWDELPPAFQEVLIQRGIPQRAAASTRRLPWLDSSLRKFFRGETDAPGAPTLVPRYFRDGDLISQSEASDRFGYLLERGPRAETGAKLAIEIEYDLLRDRDWATMQRRVLEEARRQWEQRRYDALDAGFIIQDTQPQLATHVRWLFLHICPQPDIGRPLGWRAIAEREHVSVEAVRDAVIPIANELGLTLPRLPAGRPRSSTRTYLSVS